MLLSITYELPLPPLLPLYLVSMTPSLLTCLAAAKIQVTLRQSVVTEYALQGCEPPLTLTAKALRGAFTSCTGDEGDNRKGDKKSESRRHRGFASGF